MLSFCSWDLYGNLCAVGQNQGQVFLINMFFGVALNAGSSIAGSVTAVLSGFTSNITMAIRPQIIKRYAARNIDGMLSLLNNAIKYNILLQACISVPLIMECNYVLTLWLGVVPPFAVVFCRIQLIASILRTTVILMNVAIHATGKIRQLSFISGSVGLIQLPIIYIILKMGGGAEWCYLTGIIGCFVTAIIDMFILRSKIKGISLFNIFLPYLYAIFIATAFAVFPIILFQNAEVSFTRLIGSYVVYSVPLIIFSYFCVLDKGTRQKVKYNLMAKLNVHRV